MIRSGTWFLFVLLLGLAESSPVVADETQLPDVLAGGLLRARADEMDFARTKLLVTNEALTNGIYLKRLSRREAVGVIATGLLDHMIVAGRYEEAVAVADVLIEVNPADAYSPVKKGRGLLLVVGARFHPEVSEGKRHSG